MRFLATVFILVWMVAFFVSGEEPAPPLPSKATQWLDGQAFQWQDYRGKVVVLNVWTFGCWNSYRSLPWLTGIQQKYPNLQIIGIHSPEFAYEKDRQKMRELMARYKANYPQILDDDFVYWRQLNNRYWPSFYVVDKKGNIRGRFAGETHEGDSQSKQIEGLIETLQKEK